MRRDFKFKEQPNSSITFSIFNYKRSKNIFVNHVIQTYFLRSVIEYVIYIVNNYYLNIIR